MQLDWLWFLYRVFQKYGCLYFDQLRPILGQVIFAGDLQTCQAEQMYSRTVNSYWLTTTFWRPIAAQLWQGNIKKEHNFFFEDTLCIQKCAVPTKLLDFLYHTLPHTHMYVLILSIYLSIYLSSSYLSIYLFLSFLCIYLSTSF